METNICTYCRSNMGLFKDGNVYCGFYNEIFSIPIICSAQRLTREGLIHAAANAAMECDMNKAKQLLQNEIMNDRN